MATFKLTPRTLEILKNFQTINPSIVFRPGRKLTTMSIGRKVLAFADIEQEIHDHFGIYELNKFFGSVSLFKDPQITFAKPFIIMQEDNRALTYVMADPQDVVAPDENTISDLPEFDVEFKLTEKNLKDALKAAAILNQPHVAFDGHGTMVNIATYNIDKPSNEIYESSVGEFSGPGSTNRFKIITKLENLKLFPGDYTVRICFKLKALQFVGNDVSYLIAAESKSTVD